MKSNEPNMWKVLYWELRDKYGRFNYLSWLMREIPGKFGMMLRRKVLGPYFAAIGEGTVIHPGVKIRNVYKISIGRNVWLGEDVFIQAGGGLDIGDNVALGPGVKIWTQNHKVGPTGPVDDINFDFKKVVIDDDVWIGANAFIMPGARIPRGAIVSAGAVVGQKVYPPYSIIAGNPARVVGNRSGQSGGADNAPDLTT